MAGHSKWANIKHRKAAQDAKRGKLFTKLIRELISAAREGGDDPAANPRLRAAIDKALSSNMKRDTIDNAVARGAGNIDGENMESVVYEGYGPGGAAVMVETLTDNRNRTVSAVRHAFSKHGGNLGTDGSVSYLFTKLGVISFEQVTDEERLFEIALEAGAEDIISHSGGQYDVHTQPDSFGSVKDTLAENGYHASHAEVAMIPSTQAELDEASAETFLKLVDTLEESDDVQNVFTNAYIPDDIMAGIED